MTFAKEKQGIIGVTNTLLKLKTYSTNNIDSHIFSYIFSFLLIYLFIFFIICLSGWGFSWLKE